LCSCTAVFTPRGAGRIPSTSWSGSATKQWLVDLPGHGARVDEESTLANRPDAIVSVLRPGDVLVGHSGGGFDATLAADVATDLVSHIVYLAAALPREGRTYPEAMAMRDTEEGEFDADVGEMLGYLHFDDDGAMTFADFEGAWKYFYHDCDEQTAHWAFERLGPERFGDTTVTPVSVPRRLGVDQLTIDASHSPFLSRPRELAELLVHATTTKPIGPLIPDYRADANARSSRATSGPLGV
jgi:pimeloyl-ACP methyl ester carboxylesterase